MPRSAALLKAAMTPTNSHGGGGDRHDSLMPQHKKVSSHQQIGFKLHRMKVKCLIYRAVVFLSWALHFFMLCEQLENLGHFDFALPFDSDFFFSINYIEALVKCVYYVILSPNKVVYTQKGLTKAI